MLFISRRLHVNFQMIRDTRTISLSVEVRGTVENQPGWCSRQDVRLTVVHPGFAYQFGYGIYVILMISNKHDSCTVFIRFSLPRRLALLDGIFKWGYTSIFISGSRSPSSAFKRKAIDSAPSPRSCIKREIKVKDSNYRSVHLLRNVH